MRKIFNILFPVVAVVAGIVVIVLGVNKMNSKKLYDASTTGVIVGIEREWIGTDGDGFDRYDYTVYVDYEVYGKKYENVKYPSYDSSMQKGDEVEILFSIPEPRKHCRGQLFRQRCHNDRDVRRIRSDWRCNNNQSFYASITRK